MATPLCVNEKRFQHWTKLIRVTSLVFKAIKKFKLLVHRDPDTRDIEFDITVENMLEAENFWYQQVQQESFMEEIQCLKSEIPLPNKSPLLKLAPFYDQQSGLIKVGGRLQFSQLPEETKHQIILPGKHPVVEKLIFHTHEIKACHAGPETTLAILRERVWILHGRRSVQRVIHSCRVCRRFKVGPLRQKMAPLPTE